MAEVKLELIDVMPYEARSDVPEVVTVPSTYHWSTDDVEDIMLRSKSKVVIFSDTNHLDPVVQKNIHTVAEALSKGAFKFAMEGPAKPPIERVIDESVKDLYITVERPEHAYGSCGLYAYSILIQIDTQKVDWRHMPSFLFQLKRSLEGLKELQGGYEGILPKWIEKSERDTILRMLKDADKDDQEFIKTWTSHVQERYRLPFAAIAVKGYALAAESLEESDLKEQALELVRIIDSGEPGTIHPAFSRLMEMFSEQVRNKVFVDTLREAMTDNPEQLPIAFTVGAGHVSVVKRGLSEGAGTVGA